MRFYAALSLRVTAAIHLSYSFGHVGMLFLLGVRHVTKMLFALSLASGAVVKILRFLSSTLHIHRLDSNIHASCEVYINHGRMKSSIRFSILVEMCRRMGHISELCGQ